MKIPDKVVVGGHTYRVIKDYVFTERIDQAAQFDAASGEIKLGQVWRETNKDGQEEIFLHEVVHAVDCVYNGARLQESDIESLGQGLYQVLKDNKIF